MITVGLVSAASTDWARSTPPFARIRPISYWLSVAGFGPNSTPSVFFAGDGGGEGASATTAGTDGAGCAGWLRSIGRECGIGAEGPSATLGEVGRSGNTGVTRTGADFWTGAGAGSSGSGAAKIDLGGPAGA